MSAPAPPMLTAEAQAMAARLGLRAGRPNQEIFAETLLELARRDRRITVVTSDSRGSAKLGEFWRELPDQLVEVGIAEQNLVGVAAGLAAAGRNVFAVSPACFLTARALEQIKNDVAYSDQPVRLVGISAGVSYGALGSTHHALHDLAALRAIHNVELLAPADNFETAGAVRAAAEAKHPVYLRLGKAPMLDLHREATRFEVGRAVTLRPGTDAALLATGEAVVHAVLAAALLEEEGITCRVLSVHTLRPLDAAAVVGAGRECRAVVTVEEHLVHGGLGEACAALLLEAGVCPCFRRMGIPDEDTLTGAQADIFRHYGLSMEGLAQAVRELLG